VEWAAELLGTAALVFIGFSTGALIFGTWLVSNWLPGVGPRLFVAGLCFGRGGTLVTLSPLGQRSGAHLNPSVSLAFFVLNRMHRQDLLGYIAAPFLGAGAAIGRIGALMARVDSGHGAAEAVECSVWPRVAGVRMGTCVAWSHEELPRSWKRPAVCIGSPKRALPPAAPTLRNWSTRCGGGMGRPS
jgi:hypothetical protein